MAMNAITIKPELERDAAKWARLSGQTLDAFVERAVARLIDDFEDIAAAEGVLRDYDPSTNVSLDEVMRRLGLED